MRITAKFRWYGCTLSKLFRLGDGGRMAHSMLHSTGACRCQIYSVVSRQHRNVMASHAIHRGPDVCIYTVVVIVVVVVVDLVLMYVSHIQ